LLDFIYISFIGLSVLCGLLFTKKASHIAYKLFLFFLIITLGNEIICYFFKKSGFMHTLIFYNIYYYFRFTFLGVIYQCIFTKKDKAINYFINSFYVISVLLFFICWYLYNGIYDRMHTIYLLVGSVFVIINCMLLFYKSVKNEEVIKPLMTDIFKY
jgi:hypothetical protein